MIGEAGKELVLPLTKPGRMSQLLSQISPSSIGGNLGGLASSATNNLIKNMNTKKPTPQVNNSSQTNNNRSSFVFSPSVTIHIQGDGDANSIKSVIDNNMNDLKRQFDKWLNEKINYQKRVALV